MQRTTRTDMASMGVHWKHIMPIQDLLIKMTNIKTHGTYEGVK